MGEIQIPKVILDAMQEQLALLQKAVDRLTKQNQQKDERIGELEQALLNMQRARFGQQSEKRKYVLDDGTEQISMFDEEDSATENAPDKDQAASPEDTGEIEVAAHTRKARRTHRELFGSLPVEEITEDLPEAEKVNANGVLLVCVGREYRPGKQGLGLRNISIRRKG